MLKLELRVGDSVRIGDAVVTLEDKSGRAARLSIKAPESMPIRKIQQTTPAMLAKGGIGPMPALA